MPFQLPINWMHGAVFLISRLSNKDPIPLEFRKSIGNRIYGCDDCLAACPWNKFAVAANEIKLQAREDLAAPSLTFLLTLDDDAFRRFFTASPIKRIGRDQFMRNVLIAAGNSNDKKLLAQLIGHASDTSALVRGAAVWALIELLGSDGAKPYIDVNNERNPSVILEMRRIKQ
jgi:epoxyqueuosine reductase